MIRVFATREGLVGQTTASGYVIQPMSWFAALPSRKALGWVIRIWRQITPDRMTNYLTVPVLDVGPWETHDDAYVLDPHGTTRPLAEHGVDGTGRKTNGAGIDLGEGPWKALGMTDNGYVYWERWTLTT